MATPIIRATIIGLVLAVGTLALVVYSILSSYRYTCEACVSFGGQTSCREASGRTPEAATRMAVDTACAFIARGMTETVQCTGKPPERASCTEH